MATLFVKVFGKSTLGLAYGLSGEEVSEGGREPRAIQGDAGCTAALRALSLAQAYGLSGAGVSERARGQGCEGASWEGGSKLGKLLDALLHCLLCR